MNTDTRQHRTDVQKILKTTEAELNKPMYWYDELLYRSWDHVFKNYVGTWEVVQDIY